MNQFKYDEVGYAEHIYMEGVQTRNLSKQLEFLALYARDYLGMKAAKRREFLYDYCEKHLPCYSVSTYYKVINRALVYASKRAHVLVTVKEIPVYRAEVDYITAQDLSRDERKMLFTLLVRRRLDDTYVIMKNYKTTPSKYFGGTTRKYTELGKQACIKNPRNTILEVIRPLASKGYVTVKQGGLIQLDFLDQMEHEGEIAVNVTGYEKIGIYMDYLTGEGKVKLCETCGAAFGYVRSDETKCSKHKEYNPKNHRIGICMDCGEPFVTAAASTIKVRCDKCQEIYRKEQVKEAVAKHRAKV